MMVISCPARSRWGRALSGLATLCLLASIAPRAGGQPARAPYPTVPIRFVVAEDGGTPVADEAWLAERVQWAERIFEPAGVSFRATRTDSLGSEHLHIVSRGDRHVFGGMLEPGFINVFVVASLADVDIAGRHISGVHWRSRTHRGTHYVILSRVCGRTVLAHELGHFYGNRHSPTPGNIMSYDRGGVAVPFFDAAQLRRIDRFARRFLRTEELTALPAPATER